MSAFRPNLVIHYIDAMRTEYNHDSWVHSKHYDRFVDAELRLMRKGINPKHYAQTIAKLWKLWCKDQGLPCVPINTFLGQKSMNWYANYAMFAIDLVNPDYERAKVLSEEYMLASYLIRSRLEGHDILESELIERVNLSEHWHLANAEDRRPKSEVAEAIAELCGVECLTNDYNKLSEVIRDRQIRLEQAIS